MDNLGMKNGCSIAKLDDCLNYKNEKVIKRFAKLYRLSLIESELIFLETKRWLWLTAEYQQLKENKSIESSIEFLIIDNIVFIDEMWHNFILFSEDYTNFCQTYFGYYLHHYPIVEKEYLKSKDLIYNETKEYLSYLWDSIGEKRFKLWFITYAKKYSQKKLSKRIKL